MKKRLIIFHGSSEIIEKPKFGYVNSKNDYGLGFYYTEDIDLIKEWSVVDEEDGYANQYELDTNWLTGLDLSRTQYNILH